MQQLKLTFANLYSEAVQHLYCKFGLGNPGENEGQLLSITVSMTDYYNWYPSEDVKLVPTLHNMDNSTRAAIMTTVAVTGAGVLLYAIYQKLRESKGEDKTDSGPVIANITKYGKPGVVQELRKPGYFILYNNQTKTPVYVVEKLTADSYPNRHMERKEKVFHSDDAILSNVIRSTNADYAGSGYDQGRMAAAANHSSCEGAQLGTLTLSNAVPQFAACNKGNWTMLEDRARTLAQTSRGVYVYSGPLFVPQEVGRSRDKYVVYQVIGENTVAVPTHFFKILVIEQEGEEEEGEGTEVECYLVENAPDLAESLTLQDMRVDLSDIERWTGLVFDRLHKLL